MNSQPKTGGFSTFLTSEVWPPPARCCWNWRKAPSPSWLGGCLRRARSTGWSFASLERSPKPGEWFWVETMHQRVFFRNGIPQWCLYIYKCIYYVYIYRHICKHFVRYTCMDWLWTSAEFSRWWLARRDVVFLIWNQKILGNSEPYPTGLLQLTIGKW